nr:hypothetical protein [Tanacetum cinerariifolium]
MLACSHYQNVSKQTTRIVPLFDTMLVHQGEGSGTPTEPYHTTSPEADTSHPTTSSIPLSSLPTALISPVTQTDITPIRQYSRRARIAQSSTLPTIADEPASLVRDASKREACPTESGFIADQDRATIAKSSTLPYDSAPRVTSPAADEDSMQQTISELMALCTSLQRQHSELLVKFQAQEVDILREAAAERISDESKEIARVLTSMDAATVLAGGIDVPTGSGSIPTTGPPTADISTGNEVAPTASLIVTSYSRRKGKEVMVESDTPKRQRLQEQIDAQVARELEEQQEKEDMRINEQIARDAEVARIHAEEELQGMIDSLDRSNETIAKYLQEYQGFASELPLEKRIELISDLVKYQENYSKLYKFQSQQRRPMTKKQKRDYYMVMIRNNLGWKVKDFKCMTYEEIVAKFAEFWKQEYVKKQKTSEEAPKIEKSTEEISEEKMKEMMQLVPVEDVYVQALQLDREDLNQLWSLMKEYLSIRPATSEKEMELWVELKRLYEPDFEDQLWAQTQNYMHAPTEWKLYNLSGVHHVTAKDKEIFMLVEKDYPLRKGLALVMISYKLQKEHQVYGRIVGNKMHKAFPLLVRKFPLPEGTFYCLKKNATARRKVLPLPEVCIAIIVKEKPSVKDDSFL